jgi:hypothetical protein
MRKRIASATAVIALLLAFVARTVACSWAIGYFDQVTSLRGTVVGSRFPVLHSFRWVRQSVVRPQAKLTLYRYCWPCDLRHLTPVKSVITGRDGKFDFGIVEAGHYYLGIDDEEGSLSDWFEVEVKGPPKPKESVIIDISPVHADCTGGHEFMVKTN